MLLLTYHSRKMNQKTIVAIVAGLMVTGVIAALILSRPWIAFRTVQPLEVTGYAEIPVKADIGIMSATVVVTSGTSKTAYETAGQQLENIRALLEDQDPKTFSIEETAPNISEVLQIGPDGNRTNKLDYYAVYRSVEIKSGNVEMIETLSHKIYDLNAEGMRVTVSGPRFLVSDLGDVKLQLVKEATRNGMERARTIAKNAKANLGKLVSARQGVIQITQPDSTDTADWGMYDTQTIDKVAKVTVHLELGIK